MAQVCKSRRKANCRLITINGIRDCTWLQIQWKSVNFSQYYRQRMGQAFLKNQNTTLNGTDARIQGDAANHYEENSVEPGQQLKADKIVQSEKKAAAKTVGSTAEGPFSRILGSIRQKCQQGKNRRKIILITALIFLVLILAPSIALAVQLVKKNKARPQNDDWEINGYNHKGTITINVQSVSRTSDGNFQQSVSGNTHTISDPETQTSIQKSLGAGADNKPIFELAIPVINVISATQTSDTWLQLYNKNSELFLTKIADQAGKLFETDVKYKVIELTMANFIDVKYNTENENFELEKEEADASSPGIAEQPKKPEMPSNEDQQKQGENLIKNTIDKLKSVVIKELKIEKENREIAVKNRKTIEELEEGNDAEWAKVLTQKCRTLGPLSFRCLVGEHMEKLIPGWSNIDIVKDEQYLVTNNILIRFQAAE